MQGLHVAPAEATTVPTDAAATEVEVGTFEALRPGKRCGIDTYGFFLNSASAMQILAQGGPGGVASESVAAQAVRSLPAQPVDEIDLGPDADASPELRRERLSALLREMVAHDSEERVRWWSEIASEIIAEYAAAGDAGLHSRRRQSSPGATPATPPRNNNALASSFASASLHCNSTSVPSAWARAALLRARTRVRRAPLLMQERRVAWQLLTGALFRPISTAEYAHYLQLPIASEHEEVILRDLGRTLPLHCLFKDEHSAGQKSLRRLLHAYVARDPVVGYCQGMGFIAAVLLLHMREEEAFGVLWQMMRGRHYGMCQLFAQGFPLLQKMLGILRGLIARFLPRLDAHLEVLAIDPAFFASHWFLTLFAYQFPVPLVCRIWDLFFSEGWKIVFKVAIALLQWDEEALLHMSMENVLMHVKVIHERKAPDAIVARAMALPIKERDLRAAAPSSSTTVMDGAA